MSGMIDVPNAHPTGSQLESTLPGHRPIFFSLVSQEGPLHITTHRKKTYNPSPRTRMSVA